MLVTKTVKNNKDTVPQIYKFTALRRKCAYGNVVAGCCFKEACLKKSLVNSRAFVAVTSKDKRFGPITGS